MINKNIIFAEENIIAHGCNCQGKMGSGVAKAIRARWPNVYEAYRAQYETDRGLVLGDLIWAKIEENKYVANCLTQQFYGYDNRAYASLEAITKTLDRVAEMAQYNNFSIALPPIGCGLGGLSWNDVGPIVEKIFNGRGVRFQVYDYRAENWQK